jgi:hypothetical protein
MPGGGKSFPPARDELKGAGQVCCQTRSSDHREAHRRSCGAEPVPDERGGQSKRRSVP